MTASNDRTAKISGLVNGHWQEKKIIQHSSPVYGARFSPDGKHLVLISHDDTNKILGLVDGQWQPKATIGPSGLGLVRKTSFSPDGYHLVITFDDIAKIWVLKGKNDDSC